MPLAQTSIEEAVPSIQGYRGDIGVRWGWWLEAEGHEWGMMGFRTPEDATADHSKWRSDVLRARRGDGL